MDTLMQFLASLRSRLFPRGAERVTRALASFESVLASLEAAVREMEREIMDNADEVDEARRAYYALVGEKMTRERVLDAEIKRAQNVRRNIASLVEG